MVQANALPLDKVATGGCASLRLSVALLASLMHKRPVFSFRMDMAYALTISALLVCPTGWLLRRSPSAPQIIILALAFALVGELLMRLTGADMTFDWMRPEMLG